MEIKGLIGEFEKRDGEEKGEKCAKRKQMPALLYHMLHVYVRGREANRLYMCAHVLEARSSTSNWSKLIILITFPVGQGVKALTTNCSAAVIQSVHLSLSLHP